MILRIAFKHTRRAWDSGREARLRASSSGPATPVSLPVSAAQLCRRMRRGSWRTIFLDSVQGMRSKTSFLGIFAANFRSLLLSPIASRLNSLVTILRSAPCAFLALLMMLLPMPSLIYRKCVLTASSRESDQRTSVRRRGVLASPKSGSTRQSWSSSTTQRKKIAKKERMTCVGYHKR
ncbi:hypothetical protein DFH94DRAFT_787420 [Russula ochroleuca]|uniref:Uncharacterized protein n=1 Tax=Russula ochroleuca TaxID=152965 RepID=A0A9P5JTL6_9AGAM|nr:hypothetical protein DFH94DRAFT_787420 [Russula ochroleuca]